MKKMGFSLLELTIVIMVIFIVALVAGVKIFDFRQYNRNVAARAALDSIRSAVYTWYDKNDVWPNLTELTDGSVMGESVPKNPINHDWNNVMPVAVNNPAERNDRAWFYNANNGRVWAGNNTTW